MYNKRFLKKLFDIEQLIQGDGAEVALEKKYYNWLVNNPLRDGSDFCFDDWMDSMPCQFGPFFIRAISKFFPQLS
jgi:hypothetical protein